MADFEAKTTDNRTILAPFLRLGENDSIPTNIINNFTISQAKLIFSYKPETENHWEPVENTSFTWNIYNAGSTSAGGVFYGNVQKLELLKSGEVTIPWIKENEYNLSDKIIGSTYSTIIPDIITPEDFNAGN